MIQSVVGIKKTGMSACATVSKIFLAAASSVPRFLKVLLAPRLGETGKFHVWKLENAVRILYFLGNFRNPLFTRNTLFPKEFPEIRA